MKETRKWFYKSLAELCNRHLKSTMAKEEILHLLVLIMGQAESVSHDDVLMLASLYMLIHQEASAEEIQDELDELNEELKKLEG